MTGSQQHVLAVMRSLAHLGNDRPTVREVAAAADVAPSAVHRTLRQLRALGRVEWQEGKVRTLRLTVPPGSLRP